MSLMSSLGRYKRMPELFEIYSCETCGNIIKIIHKGKGDLICCEKPMVKQVEKTNEAEKEKHVPVIKLDSDGILVKVGEVPHPMEEKHYIEWIEVRSGNNIQIKGLSPGEKPEAHFCMKENEGKVRSFCNIHGLWTDKA